MTEFHGFVMARIFYFLFFAPVSDHFSRTASDISRQSHWEKMEKK